MEAAAVFEGVLWALGIQYGYSDSKPQQPVSDALQQLHLQGGVKLQASLLVYSDLSPVCCCHKLQ